MKGNRTMNVFALPSVVMVTVVLMTTTANAGEVELVSALTALEHHVDGTAVLNAGQIEAHKLTIDDNRTVFGDSASIITASFDLVSTYDSELGPLWATGSAVPGTFRRKDVVNDINWTMFNVMQNIMDETYTAGNISTYQSLLDGFKFGSSSVFPGAVVPPATQPALIQQPSMEAF